MTANPAPLIDAVSPQQTNHVAKLENASPAVLSLFARYYPGYRPAYFYDLVVCNLSPSLRVLEIGAGSAQNHQHRFDIRSHVAEYVGIDPDPAVLSNPYLGKGYQCSAESLPFPDHSFDLVFHNYVAEHFRDSLACNREISRVLQPGGLLLFQTPSRFYYASVAAQLTPHWFHEFYVRRFASGRTSHEVFPTFYRLNDAVAINRQLCAAGFAKPHIEFHSLPPGYLRFNRFAFLLGILYQRSFERALPHLRATIIVTARKALAQPAQTSHVTS